MREMRSYTNLFLGLCLLIACGFSIIQCSKQNTADPCLTITQPANDKSTTCATGQVVIPREEQKRPEQTSADYLRLRTQFNGVSEARGIALTDDEWRILTRALAECQTSISDIQDRLMHESLTSGGAVQLTIPAFIPEGLQIRKHLLDRLKADLGPDRFHTLIQAFEGYLESYFTGFGAMEQLYQVEPSTEVPGAFMVYYAARTSNSPAFVEEVKHIRALKLDGNFVLSRNELEDPRYRCIKRAVYAHYR